MPEITHLFAPAREALNLPERQRIAFCSAERWIGYARARSILEKMSLLLLEPDPNRPTCMLVLGRPNNGKTTVLKRFLKSHADGLGPDGQCLPHAIWLEMPPKPVETVFLSALLRAMGVNHHDRASADSKRDQAIEVIQCTKVESIVIDEFSNLANAGKDVTATLAVMRNISNVTQVHFMAGGIQPAMNMLGHDSQLRSRFVVQALHAWRYNVAFQDVLATFEKMLPLARPSNLAGPMLSRKIHAIAGETIGGTIHLLRTAATQAILSGHEMIDERLLDSLDYVRPGDDRGIAEQI